MTKSIGVFDSGVGGLTVLRSLHRQVPGLGTVYLGDTARVPYGTRSAETVRRYALRAARFLVDREDLEVLVVACNTASAVALEALREELPLPVVGVIEPTAKRAVAATKSGRVGIIGTAGTVESGAYQQAVVKLAPKVQTFARPCPLLVPLAEEGWTDPDDPVLRAVLERYLTPFVQERVDTLILGCTHYPLLRTAIAEVLGPEIALAEAGDAVAEEVRELTRASAPAVALTRRYYVTDRPRGFSSVAERFLGGALEELLEVDLP